MKSKPLPAVPVLAEPTEKDGASDHLAVGGEARESTKSIGNFRLDSRGGSQKPLRTPKFQAFLDSLEPQPWKRKKLAPNWATCHFNPVPK